MALGGPRDMMDAVASSMAARTGRSLEEWVALVEAGSLDPLDQKEVRKWLKREHGVPQNSQWAIADAAARAAGWVRPTAEEYIEQQYAGPKAGLRPVFDALRTLLVGLGDDVEMEGRATYVPFVRGRQFAVIAPATKTRVDLGLRFTEAPLSERLLTSSLPGQATHRVAISSPEGVDSDVERLARLAYEQNP